MAVAVTITRLGHSVPELRSMAARSVDGAAACHLLAIAHVLDGASRAEAAALCGMDRQTLRDWVHRFNADGIVGLVNRTSPGRRPALSDAQMAEKDVVLAGANLAMHGVVRWRCSDLRGVIAERFGVVVHERTVGKLLRRVHLTRLQPRPHNPKWDEAAQKVFKKAFPRL